MNSAQRLFPLVRHASNVLTPFLLKTPLTPNHLTTLSLLAGLACAAALTVGSYAANLLGGVCLVICYILDNCDGEVARRKGLASPWGALFDSASDGIVHILLFAALAIGADKGAAHSWWLWLGGAAALGTLVNSVISLRQEARIVFADSPGPDSIDSPQPLAGVRDWFLYVFRELCRADFCFLLLLLAAFDIAWVLLPAAAIGAQVYWLTGLSQAARQFHV